MIRKNLLVALLGVLALGALFFKLPGVPEVFGISGCKSCTAAAPYLPMIAAAYFTLLITTLLSFPSFPSKAIALGGLLWAVGLSITLTYYSPTWCFICLFAHLCHISIWTILLASSRHKTAERETLLGVKLSVVFTAPIATMALFSTLNFSFLVYGVKKNQPNNALVEVGKTVKSFQIGEKITSKELFANYKGIVLHFVTAHCPYCKEQAQRLNEISKIYSEKGFYFVNISSGYLSDLREYAPDLEWSEDNNGEMAKLFGVAGFPTTVLLDSNGKVMDTTLGVSDNFEKKLKKILDQL